MKSIEVLLQVRVVVPTCLSVEFVIICGLRLTSDASVFGSWVQLRAAPDEVLALQGDCVLNEDSTKTATNAKIWKTSED